MRLRGFGADRRREAVCIAGNCCRRDRVWCCRVDVWGGEGKERKGEGKESEGGGRGRRGKGRRERSAEGEARVATRGRVM